MQPIQPMQLSFSQLIDQAEARRRGEFPPITGLRTNKENPKTRFSALAVLQQQDGKPSNSPKKKVTDITETVIEEVRKETEREFAQIGRSPATPTQKERPKRAAYATKRIDEKSVEEASRVGEKKPVQANGRIDEESVEEGRIDEESVEEASRVGEKKPVQAKGRIDEKSVEEASRVGEKKPVQAKGRIDEESVEEASRVGEKKPVQAKGRIDEESVQAQEAVEQEKGCINLEPNLSLEIYEEEDLSHLISNLSPSTQKKFESSLEQSQQQIAAFQSVFSTHNERYLAKQQQLDKPDVREYFHSLREQEKREYQGLKNSYNKLQHFFLERIKALTQAIANHMLEDSLLNQTIIGNDSYLKSMSLSSLSIGYRYGATFRIWELKQAMETRKAAIGDVKETEELSSEVEVIPTSSVCQNLAEISRNIDILKEEVIICNEALKKQVKVVADTELPRQYYIHHKQRLDEIKDSLAQMSNGIDEQLRSLIQDLQLEASTPGSPQSLAYQQEQAEIQTRRTKISERQLEIENLLNQRKVMFKLAEPGLDTKEPVKLDLSPEHKQALELIGRITALKEDITLSNSWEKFVPLEQRKFTYSQMSKQVDALVKNKDNFTTQVLPERSKLIESAVRTYAGYILNMQYSMKAIDNHFKLLERDSLERANWQVAQPKKEMDYNNNNKTSKENRRS